MIDFTVVDVPRETRFEARTSDGTLLGLSVYQRRGGALVVTHTEVGDAASGHGVGSALARASLDQARADAVPLVPLCSFVRAYAERHPEYADVVRWSEHPEHPEH